ncbi:MAG: hypothetical protein ABR915_24120, partial [Thermoguttaceae bacterium]
MERVRLVFGVLKKQYFWVLCGLLVVVCVTSWTMATNQLSQKFGTRSLQIEGRFKEVWLTNTDNHPNDVGIKKILELHGRLGENVFEAWKFLYEQQRAQNPLPKVVVQKEGFETEFEKRWGPLEKLDPNNEMELK